MAEVIVLSAFLQVLFDRLAPRAGDLWNLARREGLEKKLEAFVTMFRDVDAVLADAEDKQLTNQLVKLWLKDLKELAYDAEDVLDDFSTEALRLKVMEKQQATTSKFPNPLSALKFKFKFKMGSKIDAIMSRLKDISKRKKQLSLVGNGGGASESAHIWPTVPTTHSPPKAVYGRDKDRENIIDLLLKDEEKCDVVPIVAMGGTGKTTLAQHVYRDQVVAKAFHSKAWVCVSNDFDVIRVMKAILDHLTLQPCVLMDLPPILAKLEETLNRKRFLIVLDDIWDNTFKYDKWSILTTLFQFGASGSRMIVTTRQEKVASMMEKQQAATGCFIQPYKLDRLSDQDCWLLFKSHAFNKGDDGLHPNLKSMIIEKCKGLPLAARTLGGVLYDKRIDEWKDILNNKIWHMHGDALPIIRLSYHYLSPQLKKCFSHCAIFPQYYEFTQEELVLLWVAEGLIQQKADERVIHEGHKYFRELVSRSLFQATSDDNSKFIMHDLVHELAQQVGGETYFQLDDVTESNKDQEMANKDQERVRHSSYIARDCDNSKRFEFIHKTKRLRTFLPLRGKVSWMGSWLANSVPYQMLQLKKLRVLSFSGYVIFELPDSIGNLKHLRHLDLSETKIRCLPESTCSLYNLQILSLKDCKRLQKLPSKMENLTSLCYLDIRNADGLQEMPVGLKELKSLEVLSNFIVSKGHGCGVKELKIFKDLRGTLCISNLENVARDTEAKEASLNEKKNLEVLVLKWGSGSADSRNGENEKCVLEMLQPNQNLKELTISYYAGNAFSTWLLRDLSFSSMKFLRLVNCNRCTCLPPLGQLPSLKTLEIIGMHAVKSVGAEFYGSAQSKAFPSLESLSFEDMPEWENWSGFVEVNEQIEGFSCLSKLSIKDCPKLLGNLPNHIPSMKRLVVHKCEKLNVLVASFPKVCELDIDGCQDIANGSKQLAINGNGCEEMVNRNLPCTFDCLKIRDCQTPERLPMVFCSASRLEMIYIDGCSCLESLPIALFLLPVLEEVKIYNCENLRTLIDEVDEDINSKSSSTTVGKKLSVRCCPSLECLSSTSTLPSLITRLSVEECPKLESVAKTLPASLTSLKVKACPKLNFLPNLPISLTKLTIWDCENLTYQSSSSCFQNLTSLQSLHISFCPKLKYLPNLPISLTKLEIWNCENLTYQSSSSCFQNLTSLQLLYIYKCPKLNFLPNLPNCLTQLIIEYCENLTDQSSSSYFQNLTSLHSLCINSCPKLISLPDVPISLTKLKISKCENLTYLSSSSCFQNLTSLQSLHISRCPKLNFLPNLPISLTKLTIWDCENLTYLSSSSCFQNLTSLQSLSINSCPKLNFLPNLPNSLQSLSIYNCENLTYQSSSSCFQNLTSLRSLSIDSCPKLNSLPNLPISLTQLRIEYCENLTDLSSSSCFQNLTSLQSLYIWNCPKLKSLPKDGLPPSLLELRINECSLLKKRCKRDKGKDWHKIADVPYVWID